MFADKLKKARKEKGITQEQLARMVAVERSSIGKYESANVTPSPDVLKRIADVLDVSIDYLLDRTDEKKTPVTAADAGHPRSNLVRIAGRDGSYKERHLTDLQLAALEAVIDQMPDFDNKDV